MEDPESGALLQVIKLFACIWKCLELYPLNKNPKSLLPHS